MSDFKIYGSDYVHSICLYFKGGVGDTEEACVVCRVCTCTCAFFDYE